MKESRRIDIWVGRLAAAAGLVYVVLVSVWPLAADAADVSGHRQAWSFLVDRDDPMARMTDVTTSNAMSSASSGSLVLDATHAGTSAERLLALAAVAAALVAWRDWRAVADCEPV